MMMWPVWVYPEERYYYGWYNTEPPVKTDRDIKSEVVDHLRQNQYTEDENITVDVEHDVVILTGEVKSSRAKRAAGDDAWDVPGVVDVSNRLSVRRDG